MTKADLTPGELKLLTAYKVMVKIALRIIEKRKREKEQTAS